MKNTLQPTRTLQLCRFFSIALGFNSLLFLSACGGSGNASPAISDASGSTPEATPGTTPLSTLEPTPEVTATPMPLTLEQEEEFNHFLYSLTYDERALLNVNTTVGRVETGITQEENGDEKEFVACDRKAFSLSANYDEVAILRPTEGVVWPGSIVRANKNLLDGAPEPVSLRRSKATLNIDLPGIEGYGTIEVQEPTNSTVQLAVNKALNWWNENAFLEGYVNAANSSYKTAVSYSSEQFAMDLGLSARWLRGGISTQFSSTSTTEKTVAMLTYKQAFYKVTFDSPERPGNVFSGDISLADLERNFNSDAPAAYVHSVSYGRIISYRMETSQNVSEVDMKAAMEYSAIGGKYAAELEAKYNTILENASVDVFTVGGNAEVASLASGTNSLTELREIITGENAVYSKMNPGVPIAYTVRFLKDNSLAKIGDSTQYTVKDCKVYTPSYVDIKNNGGYVMTYNITYTQNNEKKSVSSGNYTAGISRRFDIPANAKDIKIKAEAYTGLLWNRKNRIVEKNFNFNPGNLCWRAIGTTLGTGWRTSGHCK